ncbi:hypothetical protein [Paraburkholderia atlantica]|uniref:hypothetical protein n=1 Tax=Paraburkholderia atlantica TaxID=2654982 RepID=UPI003D2396CF
MLLAIPFPKGPRGRGKVDPARAKGEETSSFRRVQQGRMVNELCPEMVKQIIDGAVGLDEAYNEATKRLGMRESKRTPDEPWRWTIPSAGAALTKTRRKLDSVG